MDAVSLLRRSWTCRLMTILSSTFARKEHMHRLLLCFLTIFLLASVASAQRKPTAPQAAAATSSPPLPSEETVNAFMHQMFGHDPSVTWSVVDIKPSAAEGLSEVLVAITTPQGKQTNKLYVTADGKHAVTGDIIPFGAHPFLATHEELKKAVNGSTLGPADAPVLLVEFSDLQCPFCKQAQPTIDKLISEEKNARLVFQNFPLPAHDWATKAAYYADCVARTSNDAFWKFESAVFDAQKEITAANADEKLTAIADGTGVKGAEIAACAAKPETAGRVQRSVALGTRVEVNSTPTLFINGRKVANVTGIPYEQLKDLVEFAAKEGQ
jgi:protein-disulfide isomerase